MSLPEKLRPAAVQAYFEKYAGFKSPLDKFFSFEPNVVGGNVITYDVLEYSRVRPKVNSRDGQPYAVEIPKISTITYRALTFREQVLISPTVLRDMRVAGGDSPAADVQIRRAVNQLGLQYEMFKTWLEASALRGQIVYTAPGSDAIITENVLDDTSVIDSTVGTAWDTTPADEATARSTLESIEADIAAAKTNIAAHGFNADTIIMNSNTFGYITQNLIVGGVRAVEQAVYIDGPMQSIFGLKLELIDLSYISPADGSTESVIPDDYVIILDSDNVAAGRVMRECEVVDTTSPENTYGFWAGVREVNEAPGGVIISAEATIGPEIGVPTSMYIYGDVTNT